MSDLCFPLPPSLPPWFVRTPIIGSLGPHVRIINQQLHILRLASYTSIMAPIRRYLRISKYSVIECRIYPEKPSDARWLLDSRSPGLPRVFAAIRPLVLPRLREENERLWMRKKAKPVKDVVSEGRRLFSFKGTPFIDMYGRY